jgi:hypothetical protein
MGGEEGPSRRGDGLRGTSLRGALLGVAAALSLAIALPLFALGVVLLIAGILSWMHPGDVASAWARTLAGVGLIGAAACLAALGGPGVGWLRIGEMTRRETEMALSRRLRFVAVIGLLLVLVCLPFGAAIRAAAHGPWLGWGR